MRMMTLAVISAISLPAWGQDKKDEKKDAKPATEQCTDDEAKTQIADYQKELKKAKGADDQIRAVENLATKKHAKIFDELKKVLLGGSPIEVRITAAEQISKYKKDEKAADTLISTAKAACVKKETLELAIKCVRYLTAVGLRAKAKELMPLLSHRETDFVREILDTCGLLKSKDTIDPIINLVLELEAVKEESSTNTGGAGGNMPGSQFPGANQPGGNKEDDKVKRKKDLLSPAKQTLKDETGEKFNDGTKWKEWWGKNKQSWKEPEEKD